MMSAALRLSLGPTSLAVEPRSMMISPSGTGALLGCQVVICVGSSSSTFRRRRRVTLRCDPRGPPVPRLGGPPRPGPAGAPVVGPPVRGPPKLPPVLLGPPGREGAPVRGAPVVGRELIGRGPPGPEGRPVALGMGRRVPGGGGIGRPVALMGRPGGGGMGRPLALMGGRVEGDPLSLLSPPTVRCVGRMVTGPSGEAVRVGEGLAGATLLRTTLGADASATTGAGGDALTAAATTGASAARAGLVTRVTRAVAGGATSGGAAAALVTAVALVAPVAFTALVALVATSGCTSRRSPSASARRRMRSACASSIDAEGLDAPIPSFWARPSNSLLVRPSSLESSCTRIFFCAKTFP
jgi:hypothetical protein